MDFVLGLGDLARDLKTKISSLSCVNCLQMFTKIIVALEPLLSELEVITNGEEISRGCFYPKRSIFHVSNRGAP